jgi:hypothetical protein
MEAVHALVSPFVMYFTKHSGEKEFESAHQAPKVLRLLNGRIFHKPGETGSKRTSDDFFCF